MMKSQTTLFATGRITVIALIMCWMYQTYSQTGIEITGLISQNEGAAGWDANGTGPEPMGNGHGSYVYYLASRDYVDLGSAYGAHASLAGSDFPAFSQALTANGFLISQLTFRFGLASQGNDVMGADWFTFGAEDFMNFYPMAIQIFLNHEPMITGLANYIVFHIGPSTGNNFVAESNYFRPWNASGSSGAAVQNVAAAFLQDVGGKELRLKFNSFGTSVGFTGNGRAGSYFNFEGSIQKGQPELQYRGMAADQEGFAGWDADGTGPEPKGNGHGGQLFYIASRDYDSIDPDPNACFAHFLDSGICGFQHLALQLAYRGYTVNQIRLRMGLRDLGEDIQGEDWTMSGTTHTVKYYHGLVIAELNGEPLVGFVCDTAEITQNGAYPGLGWWGTSAKTFMYNASGDGSANVRAVADAFFRDMENRQVHSVTSLVTAAPGTFNVKGRTGGFWQTNEAKLVFSEGPGTIIGSGSVSGHWTLAGHPYIVTGDIFIPNAQSLLIDPGVWVKFSDRVHFKVHGSLQALGDSSNRGSIVFTAVNPDLGWGHIEFDNTATYNPESIFSYCIFEYGSAPPPVPVSSPFNCGGALAINNYSNITISNCLFHHNKAMYNGYWGASGGAIAIMNSSPYIINSVFRENTSYCAGALGTTGNSSPTVANCVFFKNRALLSSSHFYGGGAVVVHDASETVLVNNLFIENHAEYKGGAVEIVSGSKPELINNIFWNNTAPTYPQIFISSNNCHVNLKYNNIQGGQSGIGPYGIGTGVYENNLDTTPLFLDPLACNFQLSTGSPCIDRGIPDITGLNIPPDDLLGNQRVWDGGSGMERIDMGPFEFNAPKYIGINHNPVVKGSANLQCYPNPFESEVVLKYTLSEGVPVILMVINPLGQMVAVLNNIPQETGTHEIHWFAGDLPAGAYFIRMQMGMNVMVARLLKIE